MYHVGEFCCRKSCCFFHWTTHTESDWYPKMYKNHFKIQKLEGKLNRFGIQEGGGWKKAFILQVLGKNVPFVLLNFVIISIFCDLTCYQCIIYQPAWPTLLENQKSRVLNKVCFLVTVQSYCFSVMLLWRIQLRRFRSCRGKHSKCHQISLNAWDKLLFNEICCRLCRKWEKMLHFISLCF